MPVIPFGTEQVLYKNKLVHLLNAEELQNASQINNVVSCGFIEIAETEYKPEGLWCLYHDLTERTYYAVWRGPVPE